MFFQTQAAFCLSLNEEWILQSTLSWLEQREVDSAVAFEDIAAMFTVITRHDLEDKDWVSVRVSACLLRPDFDYILILPVVSQFVRLSISLFERYFMTPTERQNNNWLFTNTHRNNTDFPRFSAAQQSYS